MEVQIEDIWGEVTESARRRRVYLAPDGHLCTGSGLGIEVGTYTRKVSLADFREDVYFVYSKLRGDGLGR